MLHVVVSKRELIWCHLFLFLPFSFALTVAIHSMITCKHAMPSYYYTHGLQPCNSNYYIVSGCFFDVLLWFSIATLYSDSNQNRYQMISIHLRYTVRYESLIKVKINLLPESKIISLIWNWTYGSSWKDHRDSERNQFQFTLCKITKDENLSH